MPSSPNQNEVCCKRSELTPYENDLHRALNSISPVIFCCFLLNVGIAVFIHANSEQQSEFVALIPGLFSTFSLLPQLVMTRRVTTTELGLTLAGLQLYRLFVSLFILLNVVRLYDRNSNLALYCSLARTAFEDAKTHKAGAECRGYVSVLSVSNIVVYVFASVLQVAACQKLEIMLHGRSINNMWRRREDGLGLFDVLFEVDQRPGQNGERLERPEAKDEVV